MLVSRFERLDCYDCDVSNFDRQLLHPVCFLPLLDCVDWRLYLCHMLVQVLDTALSVNLGAAHYTIVDVTHELLH